MALKQMKSYATNSREGGFQIARRRLEGAANLCLMIYPTPKMTTLLQDN